MSECGCILTEAEWDAMPKVSTHKLLTARKEHGCCECGDPILKGEQYHFSSGLWEDGWAVYRTCEGCNALRHNLSCGSWVFGMLMEDLENAGVIGSGAPLERCVLDEAGPVGAEKLKQLWGRRLPEA